MLDKSLLHRDKFRETIFERDGYKCVLCGNTAQDAHHIIERRLFPDGGYYLDNGASLCEACHIQAEKTTVSCKEIRNAAGIKNIILPPHLENGEYDKWGNPILPNGSRMRGELFEDESVQKILKQGNVLNLFSKYVKYPRTFHLPWSPGASSDDKILESTSQFEGKKVVVTVKMDGENTTLYNDFFHARSLDKPKHPSQDWAKRLHGQISHDIPEGWRIVCENLYAKHSILYRNIPDYLLLLSVWDNLTCLSWNDTQEWASLLGLSLCPVLHEGIWDEKIVKKLYQSTFNGDECEGYVVRLSDSFHYSDFRNSVAKYVRKNHVTTLDHWKTEEVIPNILKK